MVHLWDPVVKLPGTARIWYPVGPYLLYSVWLLNTTVLTPPTQINCRLAVSRSLGDSQFKGDAGQPRGSSETRPNTSRQLVSPEPSVKSVRLNPRDRVVVLASGKWASQKVHRVLWGLYPQQPLSSPGRAAWFFSVVLERRLSCWYWKRLYPIREA